jgi:quercetin dioxygenase-like cupin family protein
MTSLVTASEDDPGKSPEGDTAKTAPTHAIPEAAWCFELHREVEALKNAPQYRTTGHAARTLFKSPELRVVLIVLRRGAQLKEHKTNEPVSLHVLEGVIRVALPKRTVEPGGGGLVIIEPSVLHDIIALADSAFVLSMPWSEHRSD